MPEILRLAPSVHAAAVNDDLVFLDARRGRYICLPNAGALAQLTGNKRAVFLSEPSFIPDLMAAGLLTDGDGAPAAAHTDLAMPQRSALQDRYASPAWRDAGDVGRSVVDVMVAYRGRSFADIVGAVQNDRQAPPQLTPTLIERTDRFHRWIPYAPLSAKCLLRSFALLRHLRRAGQDALWVFGVRTWPFHAHCWLQCEDMLLDEQPDRTRAYTPIMVV